MKAKKILDKILQVAKDDERIRAVLLNGSRANPFIKEDKFQDFDIVYIVNEMETFLNDDHKWIDIFGERIILQMPKEISITNKNDSVSFEYLMLLKDGNRIDLTLFPNNKLKSDFKKDSLTIVLMDKDDMFKYLPSSSDKDYLIKRPAQKEFTDCCNEFFWVSTYVAKGLRRKQITYSKEMLETVVRPMFMKIIEWHIGTQTDFKVSFGAGGKNMKKHVSSKLYKKILLTYPDGKVNNVWNSLFQMTKLFSKLAHKVAAKMNFNYNDDEEKNVTEYLEKIYKEQIINSK